MNRLAIVGLATFLGLAHVHVPAHAQDLPGETGPYSEGLVKAYAWAAVKVDRRLQAWREKFEIAEGDPDLMAETRKQVNAELVGIVEQSPGISVEQYKRISWTARENDQLYKRLDALVSRYREQVDNQSTQRNAGG